MTGNPKTERAALDRLVNMLVDDVLSTSDEEILAEFRESYGDPEQYAADMRALFEKSLIAANKSRLVAAKTGAAASQRTAGPPTPAVDIAKARARLRGIIDTPDLPHKFTLAARNESELSDNDIVGMLNDLRELGVLPPDEGEDGSA